MHELGFDTPQDSPPHRVAPPTDLAGEVQFASPELQVQRTNELLGAGAMVVSIPLVTASVRGALAELIDESVEQELTTRGAPAPGLPALSLASEEARLSDQLYRARTVGASGIAIALGSLAAIAAPALAPEDSQTLRMLARAASQAPLAVLIDDADVALAAYAEPVPLAQLVAVEPILERTTNETVVAAREPDPIPSLPPEAIALPEQMELPVNPSEPEEAVEDDLVTAEPADVVAEVAEEPAPKKTKKDDAWRTWALALGAARGPQPLPTFEKLFAESYVPLASAIARGVEDNRALRAHDEFRRAFERAYGDAFPTFGVTGKRPRLVMDAHDVASKLARLANARTAHVLLVDSMRFDIGQLVKQRLAQKCAGGASLGAEQILWSALPSTTMRQLETIARGMDALRSPATDEPSESLRGRSAEVVRRLRVGSREIYKLDLVPAMLTQIAESSAAEIEDTFEDVADAVAESLARHFASLPPRTLVLVAGDHGFTVDRRGRLLHGGASPEEVLVPAYAWLVGELH